MHHQKARPFIVAHRGSSAYAPENTLAAFELALAQGVDGIELDAKLSADGEVVVIHDQVVNRTTTGIGLVNHLTLKQLQSLDAGSWKDAKYSGEHIPTLTDVLELVGGRCILIIEMTNYRSFHDGLAEKVVELVKHFQHEKSVIFTSFYPGNLSKVRKGWHDAPIGLLSLRGFPGKIVRSLYNRGLNPSYCLPHHSAVTPEWLAKRKEKGREVITWTVNSPERMRELIRIGVDGLITDDPLLGMRIRGES